MKIVINPLRPALCNAAQDFHMLVRLQSEPQMGCKRTPLSLVLVVDRSGSMSGSKIREAKRCMIDLVKRMDPTDRVGLVQYNDQVDTVMPISTVEQTGGMFEELVQSIIPSGSTALHAGWLRGADMLAPHAGRDEACHVILLSDGLANHGLTNTDRICEQVAALAGAGVTTTTVGLGTDFNEELMSVMARAGQGRAHYGERAIDLAEIFDAEIGLLSQLQWRNVELCITSGQARLEMLNAYDRTEDGWRMPSVAMGSECWALLRMPMGDAIRLQKECGTVLAVKAHATDVNGERVTFTGQMQTLTEVSWTEYGAQATHELVQRRMNELAAAQLQMQIRKAALRDDWLRVRQLLSQLEVLGQHEPWVAASIAFARQLMEERDKPRMAKEMLYKSMKSDIRLSALHEERFSPDIDSMSPAFLRRKVTEGRRTEP